MQTSLYTNIAFISYKREGEEWAKWFQKKLEHYKLPTEIRKKNPDLEFSAHPRHVFTDTTDQSGFNASTNPVTTCDEMPMTELYLNEGLEYTIQIMLYSGSSAGKNPAKLDWTAFFPSFET